MFQHLRFYLILFWSIKYFLSKSKYFKNRKSYSIDFLQIVNLQSVLALCKILTTRWNQKHFSRGQNILLFVKICKISASKRFTLASIFSKLKKLWTWNFQHRFLINVRRFDVKMEVISQKKKKLLTFLKKIFES